MKEPDENTGLAGRHWMDHLDLTERVHARVTRAGDVSFAKELRYIPALKANLPEESQPWGRDGATGFSQLSTSGLQNSATAAGLHLQQPGNTRVTECY